MSQIWMGKEDGFAFLLEVCVRSLIMYLIILLTLRLLGKRGVKQLSIFELVVVIGLGSAAGDPMLHQDVGIIPAVAVFTIIVLLYRLTTFIIGKSKLVSRWIEGTPTCLIEDGVFVVSNFKNEPLAHDEFFAELRLQGVSHLGQVKLAIIETNGSISTFCFPDEEVRAGLGILLKSCRFHEPDDQFRSCKYCGNTVPALPASSPIPACDHCKKSSWTHSFSQKRVT